MASATHQCANKPKCFPGGTKSGTTCTWQRKLCVTCRTDNNGITKIRVQTNNLPNHCVQSVLVDAVNFDYEVIFNPNQSYGVTGYKHTFTTQNQINKAVCPIVKGYTASDFGIVEYGDTESANALGTAINGVVFQFANQIQEDPVYPITEANEQPLDLCLGHNQQNRSVQSEKERCMHASPNGSILDDIFILPPSFKPVSLSLSRSPCI